jgi:hypothetical protein
MELNNALEAFGQGVDILFSFYLKFVVYIAAKRLSTQSKRPKPEVFLRAVFAAAVLALAAWSLYGTHIEDADSLYGGGTEVVDFEPTDAERNMHGITTFTIMTVLILTGTFLGLRDRDEKQPASDATVRVGIGGA